MSHPRGPKNASALVAHPVPLPPVDAVQQLFDWERARLLGLAKGLAGAVATVATALIVDAIESKASASAWLVVLAAVLLVELLAWSGFIVTGLRRLA